jgi:hypothetical protein
LNPEGAARNDGGMPRVLLPLLTATLVLGSCAGPAVEPPSLLPRAAEGIDPRLEVFPVAAPAPPDTELVARLDGLVAQARSGNAAFQGPMADAEQLAVSAGAAQSESWIVAQQALSAAAAARAPTTRALGDVDEISADQLERERTIAPSDLQAVQRAAEAIQAIDRAQLARLGAVSRRLGL